MESKCKVKMKVKIVTHVLFQLHTGMAADKELFNMQLATVQILFMLQHTSEDNIRSIRSSPLPINPIFFSN
jgi:hypothetical protein